MAIGGCGNYGAGGDNVCGAVLTNTRSSLTASAGRYRSASPAASRLSLAQRLERCPDLGREQLGLFPGGEVAAPGGLVEIGEGGVGRLGPAAWGPEDLARERGERDRELDRGWRLPGREGLGSPVFPVRPGRRGPGAGQPVHSDVVEDVVPGETPGRLSVDEGAGDLVVGVRVVVEHPGRQGDGGIQQGVADR